MSASREKKQRLNPSTQGLTEKEKKELKEAQQQKLHKVAYTIVAIVIAIAVAALLIWNSGIVHRNTTALTVGDVKYGPADVDYYYNSAIQQQYQYEQYMKQVMTSSGQEYTASFDPAGDLKTQYTDDTKTTSYYDQFVQGAKDALKQVTALCAAAEEAKFVLPEEAQKTLDSAKTDLKTNAQAANYSVPAYVKLLSGPYATEKSYLENLKRSTIASEFSKAKTEEFAQVSDADLDAYYKANPAALNTYDFNYCFINGALPTTDAEGTAVTHTEAETAAALSAAKLSAEAMLAAVKGGQAFGEAAPLYVAEADKAAYSNEGYTLIKGQSGLELKNNDVSYFAWLSDPARKAGDVELFEQPNAGYYVVSFDKSYLVEDPTVSVRHVLYKAAVDDPETADVDESTAEVTPELLAAAKAKAEAAKVEFESGDKTAESFGAIATRDTGDAATMSKGGLLTGVEEGKMFADFNAWIFDKSRKEGDVTILENPQAGQEGWHVIYFQSWDEPVWKQDAKTSKATEESAKWTEEIETPYTLTDGSGLKYVGR